VVTGTWLLGWYMTTSKYKGGGSMTQWIHATMHLNDAGKIDRMIQYLDRVPIMQAMPKKLAHTAPTPEMPLYFGEAFLY
jgi:hypothetical protein